MCAAVLTAAGAATAETATRTTGASATASAPAQPQAPGHHRLFFQTRLENRNVRLAYAIYLPKSYQLGRTYPMVVFLNGAGEAGDNHDGLYVHGPAAELKRNKDLADWAEFIVLAPQSPPGLRWDAPGLPQAVVSLVEHAKRTWQVDADRVYVTGLSMGGAGTWNVALAGPGVFAGIAPISSVEVQPDKMVKAVSGVTVWVICGANDGDCTAGSRKMAKLLGEHNIDVILTEIPNGDHFVWGNFYSSKLFYEFLMLHRRGQPAPPSRPIKEQLLAIAYTPPNSMDAKLAEPFKKFQPYWRLLNCGPEGGPGLKDELLGRKNVFVTAPLDAITPCRLLTTFSIAKDKKTTLELTVGRPANGRWRLTVRGNGENLLQQTIGFESTTTQAASQVSRPGQASQDLWQAVIADLTPYAGQDVRVELLNEAADKSPAAAYWGGVQLVTADLPKQPETPACLRRQAGGGTRSEATVPYHIILPAAGLLFALLAIGVFRLRRRRQ